MMGHINNLLILMVREDKGEEGVKRLFELSGLQEKKYITEVIYPEEEFQALFKGAQKLYGVNSEDAEKYFSHYFMKASQKFFPSFFKISPDARSLLEKIPTIHRNFPAAVSEGLFQDKLVLLESNKDHLTYRYDSPNKLCTTLKTVAELVLAYYRESGEVNEKECAKKGAEACIVTVKFLGKINETTKKK